MKYRYLFKSKGVLTVSMVFIFCDMSDVSDVSRVKEDRTKMSKYGKDLECGVVLNLLGMWTVSVDL